MLLEGCSSKSEPARVLLLPSDRAGLSRKLSSAWPVGCFGELLDAQLPEWGRSGGGGGGRV